MTISFKYPRLIAAMVAGTAFAAVMPAHANLITFTASGTDSDNEALSASAAFATSAGRLDLTLTNLLSANVIRSAGQALSDITFTLSGTPGTLDVHSTVGQQGNFSDTGGVVTYVSGAPVRFFGEGPPPPDGQGFFSIAGNTITLEAIGGGQPSQMIIPSQVNGGVYSNVNNGFDNFEPYTIGPATFHLGLSGVTADTTVTSAIFSFGTGPDTNLTGTGVCTDCTPTPTGIPIPEPASLALFGTALVGLGLLTRRRNRDLETGAC